MAYSSLFDSLASNLLTNATQAAMGQAVMGSLWDGLSLGLVDF